MSTTPEEPGSATAAESTSMDGYGNDTGFAEEAEKTDEEDGGDGTSPVAASEAEGDV